MSGDEPHLSATQAQAAAGTDDGGAAALERAVSAFTTWEGAPPELVVRAPGRVNLIGEHTDYQEGLALPMAIDRDVVVALRPRADRVVRLRSESTAHDAVVDLGALGDRLEGWAAYPQGIAWALTEDGHRVRGFSGFVASDVPVGAGLSSSAAITLACGLALLEDVAALSVVELAAVARRAEVEWVGTSCGMMDQLACVGGVEGAALRLDNRTYDIEPVPIPREAAVLVLDTSTRRELVGSEYNTRRDEAERAAGLLGVAALRDARGDDVDGPASPLDPTLRARARHIVSENARVERAVAALRAGDLEGFGTLMAESHASLRDDFGVVTPELDVITEAAAAHPDCFGARMTGAGFGGCAVALVRAECADEVAATATATYFDRTGLAPRAWVCRPAAGAQRLRWGRGRPARG